MFFVCDNILKNIELLYLCQVCRIQVEEAEVTGKTVDEVSNLNNIG